MAYFPFFVDIEGTKWLIAGGGMVSLHKTKNLLPYGAAVRVVSPDLVHGLEELRENGSYRERLILEQRSFEEGDLGESDYVIAATSDRSLNSRISQMCRERGIPVNVVDVKEQCSFIFPSIVRDGPVVVGISTGGMSPVIARYLKDRIGAAVPEGLGPFTAQLGSYRDAVKALFPYSPKTRSSLFYELAEEGIKNGCRLTEEQANMIISKRLEQEHE